jgi:hypothetical protein
MQYSYYRQIIIQAGNGKNYRQLRWWRWLALGVAGRAVVPTLILRCETSFFLHLAAVAGTTVPSFEMASDMADAKF